MKRIAMGSMGVRDRALCQVPDRLRDRLPKGQGAGLRRRGIGRLRSAPEPQRHAQQVPAPRVAGQDEGMGLGVCRNGGRPLGPEAAQHRRSGPLPGRIHQGADFCADLGMVNLRIDSVQPPTIFSEVDYPTGWAALPGPGNLLRHRRGPRAAGELGVRAGVRFQQAFRDRPRVGCGGQTQLRRAAGHLPRPDGGRGRGASRAGKRPCRAGRWS